MHELAHAFEPTLTKSERDYLTLIIQTKEELVRIKNKNL
jgi:hypothetical protein